MTWLQALILGLIQGITEFFPISSSAHLRLAKQFFGLPTDETLLHFDLICHLGTTLALLIFFRRDLLNILLHPRSWSPYLIGLLPLFPAYFLFKPLIHALSAPAYLPYFLLLSAAIIILARPLTTPKAHRDPLLIGLMQAIALIPGISRSGTTISTAYTLGWPILDATRFSFLLAAPAIVGGTLLETFHLQQALLPLSYYLTAFIASLLSGLLGVHLLFTFLHHFTLRPFGFYLLALSLALFFVR